MAGLQCMSQDGKGAVFTGTFLQNGDSVALCEDCLPEFLVAVASQMLGVDLAGLQAAIADLQTDGPADPALAGAEAAYPPHNTAEGAPTNEPPAPAPADDDGQAGDAHAAYPTTRHTTQNGSSAQLTDTDATESESPPAPAGQAPAVAE
jgi:hypothetical protein